METFRAAFSPRLLSSFLKNLIVFSPGAMSMFKSTLALLAAQVFATFTVPQTAKVTWCFTANTVFGTRAHSCPFTLSFWFGVIPLRHLSSLSNMGLNSWKKTTIREATRTTILIWISVNPNTTPSIFMFEEEKNVVLPVFYLIFL